MKSFFGTIGVVVAILIISVILLVVSFAGRWFGAAADVTGPQNVEQQFNKAYDTFESLKQLEQQINTKKKELESIKDTYGDDATEWPEDVRKDHSRQRSMVSAYKNQYNRLVKEYNAQMKNVWDGKLVGPPDLPDRVYSWNSPKKDLDVDD